MKINCSNCKEYVAKNANKRILRLKWFTIITNKVYCKKCYLNRKL